MWLSHAHNDYLEAVLELGLPAALLLAAAIALMIGCCLKGVRVRKRMEEFPALACAASVVVGLHALADFSLQIPAIAASYAALLGLGTTQSWSSQIVKDKK